MYECMNNKQVDDDDDDDDISRKNTENKCTSEFNGLELGNPTGCLNSRHWPVHR